MPLFDEKKDDTQPEAAPAPAETPTDDKAVDDSAEQHDVATPDLSLPVGVVLH